MKLKYVGMLCILVLAWLFVPLSCFNCKANDSYINEYYIDLCVKYGEIYNIDPNLLIAFIECESSGDASAVSANGQYIGLMQLNKDTFSGDLTDPENNIRQGAEYLHLLRTDNDGNMMIAVSYYSGEAGEIGFYTRKVINRYFELYCLSEGYTIYTA